MPAFTLNKQSRKGEEKVQEMDLKTTFLLWFSWHTAEPGKSGKRKSLPMPLLSLPLSSRSTLHLPLITNSFNGLWLNSVCVLHAGSKPSTKFRPHSLGVSSQQGERQVNHDWIPSGECHEWGERGGAWDHASGRWASTEFYKMAGYLNGGRNVSGGEGAYMQRHGRHMIWKEHTAGRMQNMALGLMHFGTLFIDLSTTPPQDWILRGQECNAMELSYLTIMIHLFFATFLWTLSTLRELRHRIVKEYAQGHIAEQEFELRHSGSTACVLNHYAMQ